MIEDLVADPAVEVISELILLAIVNEKYFYEQVKKVVVTSGRVLGLELSCKIRYDHGFWQSRHRVCCVRLRAGLGRYLLVHGTNQNPLTAKTKFYYTVQGNFWWCIAQPESYDCKNYTLLYYSSIRRLLYNLRNIFCIYHSEMDDSGPSF